MLSASHNPYQDNGIKFFGADGYKLSDETELRSSMSWSARAGDTAAVQKPAVDRSTIGRIRELRGAGEDYLRELHTRFADLDLAGLDVLLDCANGATYEVAPEIFRRLGANVTVMADEPDGRNINDECGSTHIERLAERVLEGGHALGFAFDGDGDRVLAVDRDGEVVDGDELMALAALHLRDAGRLPGDGVAVTVMTNYGFHTAMASAGIEVASTQVGDRYVLAELLRARLDAGRRAVGAPDRAGLQPHGRRDRRRAADARGAGRARTCASAARWQAAPAPGQRAGARPRGAARRGRGDRGGPGRGRGARRARARARAPERDRAARARDGRGAERYRGAGGLRPARGAGAARAASS